MDIKQLRIKHIDVYSMIFSGLLYLGIGILFLTQKSALIILNPLSSILPISNIIGIFFILYGISFLIDALLDGIPLEAKDSFKRRVREKIDHIHRDLYRWKSKSERDEEKGIVLDKPREDYASILYQNLRGKMYKFKKGPFKTYFALNTNCVLLADKIVGQAGIDIVKIQGLISPGAYFEYFNREFSKENSFVISRTIYYKGDK